MTTRNNQLRSSQGFTLIEILIVVAIIALLAAILFPAFARARDKARQAACASNLKQLGMAFVQYTQDYDEYYPPGISNISTNTYTQTFGHGWGAQLYPYVKSPAAYTCPNVYKVTLPVGGSYPTPPMYFMDYALNSAVTVIWDSNNYGAGRAMTRFNVPAKTVMLFEVSGNAQADLMPGGGQESTGDSNNPGDYWSPAGIGIDDKLITRASTFAGGSAYATGCLGKRTGSNCPIDVKDGKFLATTGWHSEGANYLLGDGHVKWYRGENVSPGYAAALTGNNQVNTSPERAAGTSNTAFQVTFSPT
jgi:prepilin-type N-terminal cleavage/methylation domain-containing protein/prepilin-type processing-associated H-X9-DG protein